MGARARTWAARADGLREGRGLLQMQGSQWRVGFAGCEALVPDRVGMRHLATLLANPGVEVRALALLGPAAAPDAPKADAVLDDAARAAYRARIDQLCRRARRRRSRRRRASARRAPRPSSTRWSNTSPPPAASAGGPAAFAGADERARTAVTKAVKRAIDVIGATCPAVADHLRATVVTGSRCRYTGTARWDVSPPPAASTPRDR